MTCQQPSPTSGTHQVPAAAALEGPRHEPVAPGPTVRFRQGDICPICLSPLEDSAAVDPCWHEFCHACIQRWAATTIAATCLLCQQPIVAIHHLLMEDGHGGVALHPHGRFHPYVGPWQGQQGRWQQQRGPGGPWHWRLSVGHGERSPPMPCQRLWSLSGQRDSDGRSRLCYPPENIPDPSWLRRVREEEPGSGDHARHLPWLHF